MLALIIVFILLVVFIGVSYFYYCKKKEKTFRMSVTLLPIPIFSTVIGLFLFVEYFSEYSKNIYIMPLSEIIMKPFAGTSANYFFLIQIFLYIALISALIVSILFIIENFVIGRRSKLEK